MELEGREAAAGQPYISRVMRVEGGTQKRIVKGICSRLMYGLYRISSLERHMGHWENVFVHEIGRS